VPFSVTFTVTKKAWMSNPALRWDAGLNAAGMNFRTGLSREYYPPIPPSGDHRTYQTADKAGFNITDPGHTMEFGSTFYLKFLLYGTSRMAGWPGKRDELVALMKQGFIFGVQNYTE